VYLKLGERIELLGKTVSGILFVLLLVSVFTGTFNVPTKANASSREDTVQATDTDYALRPWSTLFDTSGYVAKPKDTMKPLSTVIGVNETIGLELTMRLEKTDYSPGEPVNITFTLTNISNQTINLQMTAWTFDFQVLNGTNHVIFQYSTSQIFPFVVWNVQIAPGENLTLVEVWPQRCNSTVGVAVSPGTYYIVGQIYPLGNIILQTSPLQITVDPTPRRGGGPGRNALLE
jgi:hypothetical protein